MTYGSTDLWQGEFEARWVNGGDRPQGSPREALSTKAWFRTERTLRRNAHGVTLSDPSAGLGTLTAGNNVGIQSGASAPKAAAGDQYQTSRLTTFGLSPIFPLRWPLGHRLQGDT